MMTIHLGRNKLPLVTNKLRTFLLFVFVVSLQNDQQIVKKIEDFINVFQTLPRHVSARGCHLQDNDP
jgi:hypothetical protein